MFSILEAVSNLELLLLLAQWRKIPDKATNDWLSLALRPAAKSVLPKKFRLWTKDNNHFWLERGREREPLLAAKRRTSEPSQGVQKYIFCF